MSVSAGATVSRPELDIFFGEERVGTIYDAPFAFEYSQSWLELADPTLLAAIPLQPGRNDSAAVHAFFENLLPEGELRSYLLAANKASTLVSLLRAVAGDTAGSFVILPTGRTPQPASYEATSWKALGAMLAKKSASAVDIKGRGARISLAGAQDKASIAIFADGAPRLPRGTSPATHILKPDIGRFAKVWHSAANEAIITLTAAKCGLPTAEVFYEPHTQSCIVRRFDRAWDDNGSIVRLIQYDLCQLAGITSDKKYETEGGLGIVTCAALIRKHSSEPAVDLRQFIRWIFFNLYVGNNDSHAKNLSIYRVPGRGTTLTPFYDLMCTRLYPGLSRAFAFAVGGETTPGSITREHVVAMAEALRMRPQFVLKEARDLAERIPDAVRQSVATVMPVLSHSAKDLATRLQRFVSMTTKKTAARLAG